MADYIPQSDSEFTTWQANFLTYVSANLAALGLTAADLTPLTAAQTTWTTDYADHIKARTLADAAQQTKQSSRASYEILIRPLVRRIQGHPTLADSQRAAMGISLRETTRTAAGVPTTRPVVTVDTRQRLRHTISFTDETTPNSRAKPGGVTGCEIWVKVGDPAPIDGSQVEFLGMDTRTPYVAEYDGEDAGKIAHYMLRWVNTKGERGPWSQTVSATITA